MFCSHLVVAFLAAGAWAADGLGCYSSVDTSVSKGYNKYQTLSSCASSCGSSYPYVAIRDGGYCYCLLLMPTDDEVDSSTCDVTCNGYGYDTCGGANAYTVFAGEGTASAVAVSLLGSLSAASSSSLTSSTPSSSELSYSSTEASDLITSAAASTLAAAALSSLASLASLASLSSLTTVTKTASASASASASSSASSSSTSSSGTKKSTNTGAIAGGVVGGVVGVAVIAAAVFFFMRRRDSDDDHEEELYEKGAGGVSRGGTAKGARPNPAFDMPMANPFSDQFADKRASNMTTAPLSDPRLNPAMMGRRRLLEGLLADETDYSRKILAVANP